MSRNAIETVMGALVLVIAGLFLFFAYSTSQIRATSGYEVTAAFDRVDGIREGGDVRISGIKVGSIVSQSLDTKTFLAMVRLSIDPDVKLPTDTVAQIASSGLLGDKYLSLVPGGSDETIPAGGRIQFTQPAISLESLIGQYIFSSQQGQGQGQGKGETPTAPATHGLPSVEPKTQ
jgi:phospholipid/cholesterol/gamma-HCH transport system substrate-binding protein